MNHVFLAGCAIVLGVLCSHAMAADQSAYEQFDKLVGGKVRNGTVEVEWVGEDKLWFREDGAGGTREFIVVDARTGERKPAFNRERLQAALQKEVDGRADVEWIDLAQGLKVQVVGRFGVKVYAVDLATYALTPAPGQMLRGLKTFSGDDIPKRSRGTGGATTIRFLNLTPDALEYAWVSPDGEKRVYGTIAKGETREVGTYAGHAWVINRPGEEKPLAGFIAEERPGTAVIQDAPSPAATTEPTTRPTGRRRRGPNVDGRVWVRDFNVYTRDPQGRELALTTDGTKDNAYGPSVWVSPDGKKVAVYRTVPEQQHTVYMVESSPKDQKQPRLKEIQYLKPGDQVEVERPYLIDLETRKITKISTDLCDNPFNLSEPRWAKDSHEFTFVYNQRGHQVLRIVGVDAATGTARTIVDETSKSFICYSSKQYADYIDDTAEIIWMSERDGWNHLYLYDSATGKVKNQITKGEWVVRSVDRVDHDKRLIYFRASGIFPGQNPYYIHYGRVRLDGTGLTWLTQADGTHDLQWGPSGIGEGYYIDQYSRVNLPPVTELHRFEDGAKVADLVKGDLSELKSTRWVPPEPFMAKARDGVTDIWGVIFRPDGFDPAKKYPVIEQIYAGPQDSFVPQSFRPNYEAQKLAQLGFITVQIDGMGTSNRSKAFHDVCFKNLGDSGFPDRILWMKAAAAKYPYMDLSRVGIYGGSAGGQSAARAVMTQGDFYKAAVADCGCHDNTMDKIWWNEQWMGWPVGPEYAASSNVASAKNLHGKLLLMVGELDTNVDPASTMQVVDALIKANKDFEMLVFPGMGHGAGGSPYGVRRRNDFFMRNLLGNVIHDE